jgi:PAS domain S-box-containing protein
MIYKENEIVKGTIDNIKEKENSVKELSRLETYISTISSRFLANIDIDEDINSSLRDMGIISGASRVYLFLFDKEKNVMSNTHEWCAEGISPQIQILQNLEFEAFPWWIKQLKSGNLINLSNFSDLPEEAKHTKEFLELQGVKSVLVYPLYMKGVSAGFIGFNSIPRAIEWSDEAFTILRISSQIISNALERDIIEQMFKVSEEKYRLIIENINDLISIIGLHFKFEYINENSLTKLLGYTSKEIIGRSCLDFVHPKDKDKAIEALTTKFRTRMSAIELRIKHKDGNWIWFEFRGQTFRNKEGVLNTLIISRDISDRKSAEKRYKNLFENSPNAVLLINFRGIVIDANSTTKRLFGYEKEEFLGKPINNLTDIFPQEVKHFFKLIFRASFSKDFPKPIEFQVKTKNGNIIWVILQASLIKQNTETLIQFIFQDITEKKKGELITEKFKEELEIEVKKRTKELNDALEQQKLYLDQIVKSSQIKTEFMATISHELRTPLNAIIGFTDLLLEGVYGGLNEDQIDFMNDIKSSAEHQFDMIKRILDISKIESGQVSLNFQKFSLNSTVEQIRSNLKPLYSKKDLKFKVKGLEEEVFIVADPIRFKEILLNLISNAIKFTIDGKITLLYKEDYYNWIFRVRDTGIGIANKDFPLIFKEFNRVESTYVRSTPGTGLGLSLTKRLVELHGGEISFFSVLGVGSTFTFNIPKKLASRVK